MTLSQLSQLTSLPERQALQRHLDDLNFSVLRWLLPLMALGALAGLIVSASSGRPLHASLWAAALGIDLLLPLRRRFAFVVRAARPLLIAALVSHMLAAIFALTTDPAPAYVFGGYVFPALLILFRMRWFEYASVQALLLVAGAWAASRQGMPDETSVRSWLIANAVVWAVIATFIAIRITRRRVDDFLAEWRREVVRIQEEDRMRGELMDAREIQLSMLPRSTPELSWLDAAGMSIPASEVGGDYYEYFQLDGDRLAMVIGDVAGHGVASGLVLSGVRSGLHLLRDDLTRPVEVLERLNRMVRETAPQRMFVTAQVALIDRRSASVTLANAGHPPLLYLPAGGDEVRELGTSGLPLGTRLDPDYRAVTVELGRGDTLLLYTDGVLEARNLAGAEFGDKRLMEEVSRAASDGSARQVRDSILSAVSRFKGDATQVDDLTLVVLKAGDLGPASH